MAWLKNWRAERRASKARSRARVCTDYDLDAWIDNTFSLMWRQARSKDADGLAQFRESVETLWCLVDEAQSRASSARGISNPM